MQRFHTVMKAVLVQSIGNFYIDYGFYKVFHTDRDHLIRTEDWEKTMSVGISVRVAVMAMVESKYEG